MTGLNKEILTQQSVKRLTQIDKVLQQLDDADGAALLAAINDKDITAISIVRALNKRGIRLGAQAISAMRNT